MIFILNAMKALYFFIEKYDPNIKDNKNYLNFTIFLVGSYNLTLLNYF
jgi:hypothetical protein